MKIENLNEQKLRGLFESCEDVKFHVYQEGILYVYCEGMADTKLMNQTFLPHLKEMLNNAQCEPLNMNDEVETVIHSVFSGSLLVYDASKHVFYTMDISDPPKRNPQESATEPTIKGPKDGFTEEVQTNVALIRKRLQTNSLCCEKFEVGKRGNTKVALLYIKDIIADDIVEEARRRINKIDVDAVVGSGQMEEYLSDSPRTLFPLMDHIGRPDFAVESLLRGRFVAFAEGSPMAVIGPCNLTSVLKSPEDVHFPYYYTIFQRILRIVGLLIAICLPGFWIAMTAYNMDLFPFPLLATIAITRHGIPFPPVFDLLVLLGLFELFREAGVRLPKPIGTTVTVVGGLIVGDAAIRAGLTSATSLMVSSTTAVSTFTLVNQNLVGTVSVIRLFVILCSSVLGLFGFFTSLLFILVYTSNLTSFGVSYWSPISQLNWKDSIMAVFSKPFTSQNMRPESLKTLDSTRREGSQ